ncbi:MAG: aldo/keto reductase, partial [bacterium]
MKITRRDFLKWSAALSAAPLLGAGRTEQKTPQATKIPVRDFGSTGYKTTIVSFGGAIIPHADPETAFATVRSVFESGVNYIDTASQYGNGESERRIGFVLKSRAPDGKLWRDKIWLSTKTLDREYDRSRREILGSLRRLDVDYVDTIQIHAVNQEEDYRKIFGGNGSLKAAIEAKEQRYAKHIGITGHRVPQLLLNAFKEYPFDSVLIPLGAPDKHLADFTPVLEEANRRKMAVIGMKIFTAGTAVGRLDLEKCLRYSMG